MASGLGLVAEAERDAWAASTYGTGQLIAAAAAAGAQVILVAVGGSATTDGGAGALEAIEQAGGIGKAKIVVLTDVRTTVRGRAEGLRAAEGRRRGDDRAARGAPRRARASSCRRTPAACR